MRRALLEAAGARADATGRISIASRDPHLRSGMRRRAETLQDDHARGSDASPSDAGAPAAEPDVGAAREPARPAVRTRLAVGAVVSLAVAAGLYFAYSYEGSSPAVPEVDPPALEENAPAAADHASAEVAPGDATDDDPPPAAPDEAEPRAEEPDEEADAVVAPPEPSPAREPQPRGRGRRRATPEPAAEAPPPDETAAADPPPPAPPPAEERPAPRFGPSLMTDFEGVE